MFKKWLTYRLVQAWSVLVLVAAITVGGAEVHAAPPASHDDIKATVDLIPPAWSQVLPAADRFQLVLGGGAVLDKETGLVWEQSPSSTPQTWQDAHIVCNQKIVANRSGWRLPTVQELASLVDFSVPPPALPPDHPFGNVQSGDYWSASSVVADAGNAWTVFFGTNPRVFFDVLKTSLVFVWCTRGGQGVDPQ